jgi:polysaccharide export outer membrane protein
LALIFVCALTWHASPEAHAFPWGKKKLPETIVLTSEINPAIVSEKATIVIPTQAMLAQNAETEGAQDIGPESDSPEPAIAESTTTESAAPESATPVPLPDSLPEIEYTIGPGDVLSFQSWDDPSLSRSAVVLYDGTLSLPLIPDLVVTGLTRQQAEEAIKAAYADGVFKEPQLTITVQSAGSKFYYVFGDVLIATRFPYEQPISVLAALNIAGGLRTSEQTSGSGAASPGSLTTAFIIRNQDSERQIIQLDLKYLTAIGPHPSQTLVLPGDFIYVPEGVNLVYILGAVGSPNVFQLSEGQTLVQTLTRAGGPIESTAKLKNIVLMREVDDSHREILVLDWKEMMRTGSDFPLQPGDVVYVPRKGMIKLGEFISRVTAPIQQVLGLYSQMYSAYYTEDTYKRLTEDINDSGSVGILQNVRDFGQVFQNFQNSATPIPTP